MLAATTRAGRDLDFCSGADGSVASKGTSTMTTVPARACSGSNRSSSAGVKMRRRRGCASSATVGSVGVERTFGDALALIGRTGRDDVGPRFRFFSSSRRRRRCSLMAGSVTFGVSAVGATSTSGSSGRAHSTCSSSSRRQCGAAGNSSAIARPVTAMTLSVYAPSPTMTSTASLSCSKFGVSA